VNLTVCSLLFDLCYHYTFDWLAYGLKSQHRVSRISRIPIALLIFRYGKTSNYACVVIRVFLQGKSVVGYLLLTATIRRERVTYGLARTEPITDRDSARWLLRDAERHLTGRIRVRANVILCQVQPQQNILAYRGSNLGIPYR